MRLAATEEEHARPGALYHRYLEDGFEITVYRMAFNYRVCLGRVEDCGYEDAYCYRDLANALAAAASWDGEGPIMDGWHKNPVTGIRRTDGDPDQEHYAP